MEGRCQLYVESVCASPEGRRMAVGSSCSRNPSRWGSMGEGSLVGFFVFCHIGLMRSLIYLGNDFIVSGVSTLPSLFGIAIFKRLFRAEVMIEGPPTRISPFGTL